MSRILPAIAAVLGAATYASAGLVTFADLPAGEAPLPGGYQPAGLPAGVTIAFGADWFGITGEPGADDLAYVFGDVFNGTVSLTFSEPVEISSLSFQGYNGIGVSVAASLSNSPVWSDSTAGNGQWDSSTNGSGLMIDRLEFSGSYPCLDAMTVVVPEPVAISTLAMGAPMGLRRRRA
jgi:hypothetical protein